MNKVKPVFMGHIYKIVNDINNKVYIGQTIRPLEERYKQHLTRAFSEKGKELYKDIRRYGSKHFSIFLIEDTALLNERELYWIKYYDSTNPEKGYNVKNGNKTDDCSKINTVYIEGIINEYNQGYSITAIAEKRKTARHSIANILKNCGVSPEDNLIRADKKNKTVEQLDANTGEVLNIFNSITEAAKTMGSINSRHRIREAFQNDEMSFGYKWRIS